MSADVPHTMQNEFNLTLRIPHSSNTVEMSKYIVSSETQGTLSVEAVGKHKKHCTHVQCTAARAHPFPKETGWETVRRIQTRMNTKPSMAKVNLLALSGIQSLCWTIQVLTGLGSRVPVAWLAAVHLLLLSEAESSLCLQLC